MTDEKVIKRAEFNPKVCTYWLLSGALVLTLVVVGIPLLLLWFPIGLVFTRHYLSRMECVLTERTLKVGKGVLVRVEKTIPLDKITDMGMVQGPIMRALDIEQLTIETAGQSGDGALVSLTGIADAKRFRELVLEQRDKMAASPLASTVSAAESSPALSTDSGAVLGEIRDALLRIEDTLRSKGGS